MQSKKRLIIAASFFTLVLAAAPYHVSATVYPLPKFHTGESDYTPPPPPPPPPPPSK